MCDDPDPMPNPTAVPVRFTPESCLKATRLLARRDPALARLVKVHGTCGLGQRIPRNSFAALGRAIVFQQLYTGAATTIYNRVLATMNARKCPPPATWLALPEAQLRAAGLSTQKTKYILDLCRHVTDRSLDTRHLHRLRDEDVIERLTQVKGIGRWTAEMVLMFTLGRLDVWPVDDLGIRLAVQDAYALPEPPGRKELQEIGEALRPWRSVASFYLWRSRVA